MFRQDLPQLNSSREEHPFKEFGCKWESVLFWYEQIKKVYLDPARIISMTNNAIHSRVMKANLFIGKPMETPLVQSLNMHAVYMTREEADYICKWNELEILWLQKTTARDTYNHFRPGDGESHMVWDSLGLRKGMDDYEVMGKRVIVLDPEWCEKYWRSA